MTLARRLGSTKHRVPCPAGRKRRRAVGIGESLVLVRPAPTVLRSCGGAASLAAPLLIGAAWRTEQSSATGAGLHSLLVCHQVRERRIASGKEVWRIVPENEIS